MKTIEAIHRENLQLLAREFGGVTAVAAAVGCSSSQYSQWMNGSEHSGTGKPRGMRHSSARRIEKATGKPAGWLDVEHPLYGIKPLDDEASRKRARDIARIKDEADAQSRFDRARLGVEERQAPREQPEVHSPVMVFDPDDGVPEHVVLVPESRIEFSAGDGRINYEVVEDKEPVPYQRSFFQKQHINPDRVRRFPVTGDSMEPMLFGGDTILVNLDETEIIDGKLYALRYGDQLRVKYLSKRIDGTLVLRSLNPAYKDEEISAELANEHITIIGRVRDRSGTGGL